MAIRYERVVIRDGEVELALEEAAFSVRHVPRDQRGDLIGGKLPISELGALRRAAAEAETFRAQGRPTTHLPSPARKWQLHYLPDCQNVCCDAGCAERATFYFEAGGLGSYHCAKLARSLLTKPADDVPTNEPKP